MRLLLVEDESALRDALKLILEQYNFTVDAVSNGQEALDYIELGDEYDCMILDIMMPIMDGIEVIKTLREKKNQIPILVLSAKSEIEDKIMGLDLGANDYLSKPFNTQELLARVRVLTRKENTIQSSSLTLANVTLDRANFLLKTKTNSLTLPNKEFQILELLMSQPHAIIPSDTLFNKIWGYDASAEQNTIWVTISNLRKKLDSLEAKIKIKSVRNVGYTLEIKHD